MVFCVPAYDGVQEGVHSWRLFSSDRARVAAPPLRSYDHPGPDTATSVEKTLAPCSYNGVLSSRPMRPSLTIPATATTAAPELPFLHQSILCLHLTSLMPIRSLFVPLCTILRPESVLAVLRPRSCTGCG